MRLHHIDVSAQTPAGPEAVYRLLADGSTWPRWSPIESFALEEPGDPPPEGVGAIRVFRRRRVTGRDQILELIPGKRFVYASLSGLPVREYVGEVDLEAAPGGGTDIRWHTDFYPTVRGAGWVIERGIRRFLQQCARGLAAYAADDSSSRVA
jgi:hypothetical protein